MNLQIFILVIGIIVMLAEFFFFSFTKKDIDFSAQSFTLTLSLACTGVLMLFCSELAPDVSPETISNASFSTAEKQQIAGFVTRDNDLCVQLANGNIYELSDSWNCDDSSAYVMVNTDSTADCFISENKRVKSYISNIFYNKYELETNVLFVDKETYDKLFAVDSIDLNK